MAPFYKLTVKEMQWGQRIRWYTWCRLLELVAIIKNGSPVNYCKRCYLLKVQTCMSDNGTTILCGKGIWVDESN